MSMYGKGGMNRITINQWDMISKISKLLDLSFNGRTFDDAFQFISKHRIDFESKKEEKITKIKNKLGRMPRNLFIQDENSSEVKTTYLTKEEIDNYMLKYKI